MSMNGYIKGYGLNVSKFVIGVDVAILSEKVATFFYLVTCGHLDYSSAFK